MTNTAKNDEIQSENHLRSQEDCTIYPAAKSPLSNPHIDRARYIGMYQQSINEPEKFWAEQAKSRLDWFTPWTNVKDTSFSKDVHVRWFEGGTLNVSYNCIDRHLEKRGDQTAIIWEGDNPDSSLHITYKELHVQVCKFANVLKKMGVKKGDVVTLYMPMIPEATYAMLACTRIGAVHSVVFAGFSPQALQGRVLDGKSKLVITADEGRRGGKTVSLKNNVDMALSETTDIQTLVIKNTGNRVAWHDRRDHWYDEVAKNVSDNCEAEPMEAEDPLFILYTSGSTGKPKGIRHTTGGYLLYAALTHQTVFDYQEGDVYWCTADVGWITGHSYIVYGPLANGATTVMFEGIPTWPNNQRFWQVIDKHKVTQFYTAPTAIRSLMASGNSSVAGTSRKSLRILGSVGEPINPEAWRWYYETVGEKKCPIVDTWWQTETGGIMLSPLPYATDLKPGSATLPLFGIKPAIVDNDGNILDGEAEGNLCFLDSWPGQARTINGDHPRFIDTYFTQFPGMYFSGDGCRRDKDGYYWITGRTDDVLNVSGHRLGTAEIESALVAHPSVAEAGVVGFPHNITGEGIYSFITLNDDVEESDDLRAELITWVRKEIGPIATLSFLQWAPGLPKTRSGKIMRRILRKIAANDYSDLGDTNTLLNPEVVDHLISQRLNR